MIKMVALRQITYGGQTYNTGDVFELEDQHKDVFELGGYAKLAPTPTAPEAQPPQSPAAPSPHIESATGAARGGDASVSAPNPKPKNPRHYKRRDMRAGR